MTMNIVLAEDNAADVGLVREALREHNVNCNLQVIRDGKEVLAFIDRLNTESGLPCPDLLLLDWSLPKYGGSDILNYLWVSERCGQTPVIVLTGSDLLALKHPADCNAPVHYFHKPSSLSEFMKLGVIVKDMIDGSLRGKND
jgi:CheY-like chemotaxis protein